jgi:hypothetical protein
VLPDIIASPTQARKPAAAKRGRRSAPGAGEVAEPEPGHGQQLEAGQEPAAMDVAAPELQDDEGAAAGGRRKPAAVPKRGRRGSKPAGGDEEEGAPADGTQPEGEGGAVEVVVEEEEGPAKVRRGAAAPPKAMEARAPLGGPLLHARAMFLASCRCVVACRDDGLRAPP